MNSLFECDQCAHQEWRPADQEPWLCVVCGNMRWSVVAVESQAETADAEETMRKLEVDFEALATALEDHSREFVEYYFDTETGDVIDIPVELFEELEDPGSTEIEDVDEWEEECVTAARTILAESGPDDPGRYVWVPQRESREAYDTMVRFAESVESDELQRLLSVALNGRGAFRRFKDVLYDYPAERERWFGMNDAELREYAKDWLRTLGIEARPRARPQPES